MTSSVESPKNPVLKDSENGIQNINLKAGKTSILLKVDTKKTLDIFRKQLKERVFMDDTDLFCKGLSTVMRNDEKKFTISDILENSELTIKKEKQDSLVTAENTPDPVIPTADSTSAITLPEDWTNVPMIQADLTVGTGTGNNTYFFNLSDYERRQMELVQLQLYNGIQITENGVKKTTQPLVIHSCWNPSNYSIPERDYVSKTSLSFSKLTNEIRLTSATNVNAGFGVEGLKLKSEYSESQERLSSLKEISCILSSSLDIQKVQLALKMEDINGNRILYGVPEFHKQIRRALNTPAGETQCKNLLKVLNDTGFFISKQVTVGGKLYSISEENTKSIAEAEAKKKSFGLGFETTIQGSGSGGARNTSSQGTTQTFTFTNQNFSKTAIGGQAEFANNPAKWIESLGDKKNWKVISYDKLVPCLIFLDKELASKAARVLIEFEYEVQKELKKTEPDLIPPFDLNQYGRLVFSALFNQDPTSIYSVNLKNNAKIKIS